MAFAAALIGTAGSAAWADSYSNPAIGQGQMPQTTMDEQMADATIVPQHQQLLNQPDPGLDVTPWSMYRDGAGEIVNPQTGTPLPWTVQPD